MAQALQRPRHTPEEWRQLIEAQGASGQSQEAFCYTHELGQTTFQSWKRRLFGAGRSLAPGPTTASGLPDATPLFTRLTPPASGGNAGSDWTVELDLGGGVCLRLRQGT